MMNCWAIDPRDRPSFNKLSNTLGKLLETTAGYLELDMVLLPSKTYEDESFADL